MDINQTYDSLGPGFEPESEKKGKKIPGWILLFLIAALILTAFSMIRFPKVFQEYQIYREAKQRMENGETSTALGKLLEVVEQHPNSVPVITEFIDRSMEAGYYDAAAYVMDEYLAGKNLSDKGYAQMMEYYDFLERYYLTYDTVESLLSELEENTVNSSEEEMTAQVEACKEKLQQLLEDPELDSSFIMYYLALFSEDRNDYYSWLKQCYELNPELFDTRVLLGNAARRLGKLEEAREYLNAALAKDKEDHAAWRGLAVLSLLEGDSTKGLELAKQAYDLYPDGTYVRDTCIIAFCENGKTEEADAMSAELEEIQGFLGEDLQAYLDGTCTLQDYYMGD